MQWYFFAFLSPLLWAISNHIDKYILSKYLKNVGSGVLAIFAGLVGLMLSLGILIVSPSSILGMSLFHAVIIILNGALLLIAFIPYFYALQEEDASSVVPLYQMIPIFSLILGSFLLGESLTLVQSFGGMCIIFGAVLISIDPTSAGFNLKKRVFLLMLLSSFLLSFFSF
jgi:drug/metabolite transporter (DMT)-like permease